MDNDQKIFITLSRQVQKPTAVIFISKVVQQLAKINKKTEEFAFGSVIRKIVAKFQSPMKVLIQQ